MASGEVTTMVTSVDLVSELGPRRLPLEGVVPLTVLYCLIFLTGIVGNVATCVVIAHNRYMHTATNYYLFNLAVADLLVLVLGLPLETYTIWSAYPWIFGETFCMVRNLAAETSTYASISTITAFTMERYVAICHPMRAVSSGGLGLKRAVKVVVLIWLVSSLCALPIILQYGVVTLTDPRDGRPLPDSTLCTIKSERQMKFAFGVSTFLFFLTPMTAISVLYVLIGLAIRRSALSRAGSDSSQTTAAAAASDSSERGAMTQQQAHARRAVLNMLVAVVVAFFLCWAPFHCQRLLTLFAANQNSPLLRHTQHALFYISGVLYYVSSVINPILYNIMSLKFRQAFKTTLFKACCRKRKVHRPQTILRTYRFNSKVIGGTASTRMGAGVGGNDRVGSESRPEKEVTRGASDSRSPLTCPLHTAEHKDSSCCGGGERKREASSSAEDKFVSGSSSSHHRHYHDSYA